MVGLYKMLWDQSLLISLSLAMTCALARASGSESVTTADVQLRFESDVYMRP
jgi:hypothetical protein